MTLAELLAIVPLIVWLCGSCFLAWWYRNGQMRALHGVRILVWLWVLLPALVLVYELFAVTDILSETLYLMTRRFFLRYMAAVGTLWCVIWHLRFRA